MPCVLFRRPCATALILLLSLAPTGRTQAPVPAAAAGPAVLFLGMDGLFDKTYGQELQAAGFRYAVASLYDPLDPAFLKRFDLVVVDSLPLLAEEYETFGQRMLIVWENLAALWANLEAGQGVLVYPNLAGGGSCIGGWNHEMKRWGVQARQACVRDPGRAVATWKAYGECQIVWTERLAQHPVTSGLKRVYYPSANLRWDDCYTTPPLALGKEWSVLLQAMPEARAENEVQGQWGPAPDAQSGETLPLGAVRDAGRGRLAVLALNPNYLHRLGRTKVEKDWYGEMCVGPTDSVVLDRGDGTVPSDAGVLVQRLYRWLAEPAAAAGFGGYAQGDPVGKRTLAPSDEEKAFTPVLDFDRLQMPPSWRHRPFHVIRDGQHYFPEFSDPLVKGDLRFLKGLIGAHSALSDGQGTVAEYAAAARAAGYAVLVFAENFEQLTAAEYRQLVADCEANSGDDLVCLPGFDLQDPESNHFLIVGAPYFPKPAWLSPDGRRLVQTQMINLLYYNHMVIAHRPETSPLPQERLKHFQGLSVFTYRAGKLVDDSLQAYAWQVMNGSNPHPVVVHEVFSPTEVAAAAATGFQQLLPSDTARNAAGYFRTGIAHYFEAPARHLVSNGPVVATWAITPKDAGPAAENRQQFRVDVGVTGDEPLRRVTLYDGFVPVRVWRPEGKEFSGSAHFRHVKQYGLYLVAEDAKGRRAITGSMRTVPSRFHFRCSDRQNWLGHVGAYYTGVDLPEKVNLAMPVRGTAEASSLLPSVPGTSMAMKLNFPFTCVDVVLTEAILDEKYDWAGFADVAYDAKPSLGSKPSSVYRGRVRRWSFTPGPGRTSCPTVFEYDIELKRDVEPLPVGSLYPACDGLRGKRVLLPGADGQWQTGEIDAARPLDLPVGGLAGGFVALSPGLRLADNRLGLAAPAAALLPAGTRFQARFLVSAGTGVDKQRDTTLDSHAEAWLAALGLGGQAPYQITLTRGHLEAGTFPRRARPADGGVAGNVARTAQLPFDLPLQLTGVNPNWPVGLWQAGAPVAYTAVFEGCAYPRLDLARTGAFYAGSLLLADQPALVLEIITWTPERLRIEAHNPTGAALRATVRTPPEITGLKAFNRTLEVPAGATVVVE